MNKVNLNFSLFFFNFFLLITDFEKKKKFFLGVI
jgi:hypothetical protein